MVEGSANSKAATQPTTKAAFNPISLTCLAALSKSSNSSSQPRICCSNPELPIVMMKWKEALVADVYRTHKEKPLPFSDQRRVALTKQSVVEIE
ncbi:MAG: hypothetical protein ACO3CJ_09855, partial [Burkholderiaceae bacterium]